MSKYIYKGKEYSNLNEIANAFGIKTRTLTARLKSGLNLEDAIEKPIEKKSVEIEYQGIKYPSISSLAKSMETDTDLVLSRIDLGWDLESALTVPIKQINTEVIYGNKKYNSIRELSTELDIPYSILYHHYYNTQDVEKAIEKSYESICKVKPSAWNKQYDSYSQMALAYGVKIHNLMRKINQGSNTEEAILYLLEHEKIRFEGKEYGSLVELAANYEIQPVNVWERIKQGWTLKESLTRSIRKSPGIYTTFRNKSYISQIDLCRDYGISVGCIRELLRTHESLSFMDVFEVFIKFKEQCNIPYDTQINVIPKCMINGKIYNRLEDFAKEIKISTPVISSAKSKSGINDLIETFKEMQSKTVVRYIYNGEIVQSKDLKKILNSRKIQKMADQKINIPLYQSLQKYDFNDRCFDTYKIFLELLSEAEMNIQENEGFCEDISHEYEGISIGGM